ncbi:TPA: hypothetical protein ACPSKZ_000714 [Legionella anisa]|nr:hypothetical protein [Legionella anisa]MCW8425588.1 hypothetical protein [Legionella anisa]MCW8448982.1 hypothetical protein [Legionella anisa]
MNTKRPHNKQSKSDRPVKTFATSKEVNKATDKAMTQYAEAIKRLADR